MPKDIIGHVKRKVVFGTTLSLLNLIQSLPCAKSVRKLCHWVLTIPVNKLWQIWKGTLNQCILTIGWNCPNFWNLLPLNDSIYNWLYACYLKDTNRNTFGLYLFWYLVVQLQIIMNRVMPQYTPIKLGPEHFGCHFCTKTMKGKKDMQEHIFTHTGEKPYSCPKCSKSFRQKKGCQTHIKTCENPPTFAPLNDF